MTSATGPSHAAHRTTRAGPHVAIGIELNLSRITHARRQSELDEIFGLGIESIDGIVSPYLKPKLSRQERCLERKGFDFQHPANRRPAIFRSSDRCDQSDCH
ncbi:MAG: hypothetical protein M2R45_05134 [Verrucomicrobia subdivision 3 bacterium]|nr:hypothetical protein [Limisphaerales bacterium]MCS1417196.1 hypothetical protein [Limisphaerales bacterium]